MKSSLNLLLLILLPTNHAFTLLGGTAIGIRTRTTTISSSMLNMGGGIEMLTLESLQDHEEEGTKLSASIAGWLDMEWMPQEIHTMMGERAKQTYITCREAGEVEIAPIMTQVTDDLFENWREYDKDAFVNAWDIGNYVADYFHQRLGVEACDCHATIFQADEDSK